MQTLALLSVLHSILLGIPTQAHAGYAILQTMYVSHSLVQGSGVTYEQAQADALKAMPDGYVEDLGYSRMIECTLSEDLLMRTHGEKCDTAIKGNLYRLTIPIVNQPS